METLLQKIQAQVIDSLKSGDKTRLSVLRLVVSAAKNREIDKRPEPLTDEDVLSVIAKEIKDREEGLEIYGKAGKTEQVDVLKAELEILREYLPAMDEEKLNSLVAEAVEKTGAKTISELGKIMGYVMPKVSGQASPEKVREIAGKLLSA